MDWQEDMVPRRKPSQKKPPKKAKHKHDYQPCILVYERKYDRKRPKVPATYCSICGKIGDMHWLYGLLPSWMEDLPQNTPEFYVADIYKDKYVDLKEGTSCQNKPR